ncbi:hypothetical protein Egran_06692 [Elaphomyces granulatus]|uniref:Uncharacterized protein n=1 Tax=Elaphomyces granulatus TaxID=519963 RepID=A0A232LNF8_9EURO|nr:hypothetical protein Egran_06692 [Elaphomyces granulatus]
MSLLSRIAPGPARISARSITPTLAVASPRLFSTTVKNQKGPIEATKETLKKADRVVANVAIKGIDTGEKATKKVKETLGIDPSEAEGKASQKAGEAKGKTARVTGEAKGKAEEMKGEAKGKAEEVSSKLGS